MGQFDKIGQKYEMIDINGIVAELGLLVIKNPQVLGDRLEEVKQVLQDLEDEGDAGVGLSKETENHIRELYKTFVK